MRTLAYSLSTLILLAGAAHAADLYVPPPAAPAVASYDWTGFYAGIHGGYSWGGIGNSFALDPAGPPVPQPDFSVSGGVFGVQAGYSDQIGNFVLGAEGRVYWSGLSGNDGGLGGAVDALQARWGVQALAQLGYAVDRVMPYLTAGVTSLNYDYSLSNLGTTETNNQTAFGGAVGAGIKYAVTDNFILFAEYTHEFYPANSFHFPASAALNGQTIAAQPKVDAVRFGLDYKF